MSSINCSAVSGMSSERTELFNGLGVLHIRSGLQALDNKRAVSAVVKYMHIKSPGKACIPYNNDYILVCVFGADKTTYNTYTCA